MKASDFMRSYASLVEQVPEEGREFFVTVYRKAHTGSSSLAPSAWAIYVHFFGPPVGGWLTTARGEVRLWKTLDSLDLYLVSCGVGGYSVCPELHDEDRVEAPNGTH